MMVGIGHRRRNKADMFDYPHLLSSLRSVIMRDAFISFTSEADAHDDILVAVDTQAITHFSYQTELNIHIGD